MNTDQLRALVNLGLERDLGRTAQDAPVSDAELHDILRAAEHEFSHPLTHQSPDVEGLTVAGQQVLAWARDFLGECDALRRDLRVSRHQAVMAPLLERRSVSPKRLQAPGPDAEEIDLVLQAALRAPDHGSLHPWRVIEFRASQRDALADRFEQEKLRRDPLASPGDLRRAREHATRPPVLLAFIVSPRGRSKIPLREQWLAAGAALGNLLNATHQLGFGAIVLSGERCFDTVLTAELGLKGEEFLAGFISLGSVAELPPTKGHALPGEVWTCWTPDAGRAAPSHAHSHPQPEATMAPRTTRGKG